jgi:hypothetical protein
MPLRISMPVRAYTKCRADYLMVVLFCQVHLAGKVIIAAMMAAVISS